MEILCPTVWWDGYLFVLYKGSYAYVLSVTEMNTFEGIGGVYATLINTF